MNLFDSTLVSPDNVKSLASSLRVLTKGKPLNLKVNRVRGAPEVLEGLVLFAEDEADTTKGGVRAILPSERGGRTNSAQLGFVFKSHAFHFETSDDPIIERLSDNCFRITNRRQVEGDNPIVEIVFSVGAAA